ncbi:hypothetical protein DM01DRAFT_1405657 [Hesseltinella vesiculosa]|uniref:Uncharacterized protein n=1 Tax=Hesseltinella vesiculosa TaxID=101127 RepID=A0A1X2GNJ4_9FUNG|nr:hypothetical protein DM01DRAFT_1405657 [Hesseltinella vesiculosa]
MRLDPLPRLTSTLGKALGNPRLLVFAIVMSKLCLDRVYKFALAVNPTPALDNGGNQTIDILEYYHPSTASDVYRHLDSYNLKQRLAYQSLAIFDSGFVVFRAIPIAFMICWAFKTAPAKYQPGIWVVLVNVFADLLENILITILLKSYPERLPFIAQALTWVIDIKWKSFWGMLGLLFVAMLAGIYFSFHAMLANSVLLEKDRKDKQRARQHVNQVMDRAGSSRDGA